MITSASPQSWITGEEFAAERNRLRKMGLVPHSPEYAALVGRVDERNEYLWATYGEPLLERYPGKWIAINIAGEVLLGETDLGVCEMADRQFTPGDYYVARLDPTRGAKRIGPRKG